jgi:hypothetical protein
VAAAAAQQYFQVWSVRLNEDGSFANNGKPTWGGITVRAVISSSNAAAGTIDRGQPVAVHLQ